MKSRRKHFLVLQRYRDIRVGRFLALSVHKKIGDYRVQQKEHV